MITPTLAIFVMLWCSANAFAHAGNFCARVHDDNNTGQERCSPEFVHGKQWTVCGVSHRYHSFTLLEFAKRHSINSTSSNVSEQEAMARRPLRVVKEVLPDAARAMASWDEFIENESFPLPAKRGLFAIPTSLPMTTEAVQAVQHFSHRHFDVIILCYTKNVTVAQAQDSLNELGVGENVAFVRRQDMSAALHCPSCDTNIAVMKFLMAKLVLRPALVNQYSGLWFFDDDIALTRQFDANLYLSIVTATGIDFSSPGVVSNHHIPKSNRRDAHFLVITPEIMVPHYSPRAWSCIYNIIHDSTGFGLDSRSSYCLCDCMNGAILLQQPVMHNDKKSFRGSNNGDPNIGWRKVDELAANWELSHPCGDSARKEAQGLYIVVSSDNAASGAASTDLHDILACPIVRIATVRGDRWLDTDFGIAAHRCNTV